MDSVYFLIGSDSPVMQVVRKHENQFREFQDAVELFRLKHGAKEALSYGRSFFAGLRFAGETPNGWRNRKDGVCVPDSRCKAGRENKKEADALPHGFDAWTFSSNLGEDYLHFADGRVYFSTVGRYGDKYVLRVPALCRVNPVGCTELKMSEYWQIRESVERLKEESNG